LLGGLVYLGIHNLGLPTSVNIPITTVVTAGVRLAAIRFGLRLPGQSL
jgi:uncharacterized membrane protein YeiH